MLTRSQIAGNWKEELENPCIAESLNSNSHGRNLCTGWDWHKSSSPSPVACGAVRLHRRRRRASSLGRHLVFVKQTAGFLSELAKVPLAHKYTAQNMV